MNTRPSTTIQGSGIKTLANGSSVTIEPKSTADNDMVQFTIANVNDTATGGTIYVCGTDGNEALPVFPQTVLTLETDSRFKLINSSGVTVSYVVGQLFLRSYYGVKGNIGSAARGSGSGGGGAQSTRYDFVAPGHYLP